VSTIGVSALPTTLITGAAGNLGSLLAEHLLSGGHELRLMHHRRPLPESLRSAPKAAPVQADLARPETLRPAVDGVDTVVHLAGVLFAPRPEKFLPETNTRWFDNLLSAALAARVRRVILISFPHVEGPTSVDDPATGRRDRSPVSVHARTRLQEEKLLLTQVQGTGTTPVVLRLGMVYGRGLLMVEAARWLARRRLLAVWRDPTWIHLVSTIDCLRAVESAISRPAVEGIYHVGDERPVTLQSFLDKACAVWQCPRPRRLPVWMIYTAAHLCELFAMAARTPAPLTRDFIRIGQVSYWGDTRRTRADLLPQLEYPTIDEGLPTLR
jgi:nucleoside-diphosphate-sugar epimerase